MAVLTVEKNILTKRRLEQLLQTATPFAAQMLQAFMSWVVQSLGERQLQLIQFSDLGTAVAQITTGTMPKIFAVYLKKQGTATAAYFMEFDDAANPNTATEKRIQLALQDASKEAMAFYPDGLLMANGVVTLSATTANGTTGSTSGDGPNGFILIG